ncbi:MAG: Arm DNA-binding domain-containing protein, partial [Mucinivorans sp.]
MATVKTKFRASTVTTGEGALFYQVIHNRIARQINTGYKLYPSEWITVDSEVVLPSDIDQSRRSYLTQLKTVLIEDTSRLKNIIDRLEQTGNTYVTNKVVELY